MGSRQEAGEQLKQARESKRISLEEAQARTKIYIGTLRSLEKGEIPSGIGEIYLKGFIKIYAGFLELDPAPVIAGFNLGSAAGKKPQVKSVPADSAEKDIRLSLRKPELSTILKFAVLAIGLLLVVLLIFTAIKKISRAIFSRKPAKASQTVVAPAGNIPVSQSSNISLSVHAKNSTWLHIKADGRTLFQGVLRRGLSETWIAKEKMELDLGDAGGVELAVNGKRLPALGRRREAIKNIRITKEGVSVGEAR